jgi:hypothetical protein
MSGSSTFTCRLVGHAGWDVIRPAQLAALRTPSPPRQCHRASLVSVARHISPFKMRVIGRFSSTFFLATYMCTVSHASYEAC